MSTGRRRLGRSALAAIGTRFFTLGAGAAATIVVARLLGPRGFGAYSVAVLVPTLAFNALSMGVVPAASYQQARMGGRHAATTRSTFGLALVLGIAALIVTAPIASLTPHLREVGRASIVVAVVALPFLCVWNALQADLLGRNEVHLYNRTAIVDRAMLLVLVPTAIVAGDRQPIAGVLGMVLTSMGTTAVLVALAAKRRAARPSFDVTAWRPLISFGTRSHISNVAAALSYRLDIFLVGSIAGVTEAGKYTAAVALGEVLWIVSQSSSTVLFPRIAAADDEAAARALTATFARTALWVTVVLACGLAITAPIALDVVFDREYASAAPALRVLLIGVVALSVSRVLANHIAGRGRPQLNAIGGFVALAVNVALNVVLIPKHGIEGAAFASAISYTVTAFITIMIFHKVFGAPLLAPLVPRVHDIRLVLHAIRR